MNRGRAVDGDDATDNRRSRRYAGALGGPMLRALALLLVAPTAYAQDIVSIEAFSGEFREGFETQGATTAAVDCISPTFDGHATVCAPNAAVGGMHIRRDWFLTCLQDAYVGNYQAASNDSWVEIRFDVPLARFGGRFGTHANDGDVTLTFLDRDDNVLGTVTEPFVDADGSGDNCDWQWVGGETIGAPIWTVRIRHSDHAGALVDLDALQASTGCGLSDLDCDGSNGTADCDDLDPDRFPGNPEVCDGIDNDCDGSVPASEDDGDADGFAGCEDCDDTDDTVYPGATEDCDGVDQDCDNTTDEDVAGGATASLTDGVCAGSAQVCDNGSWVEPDYTQIADYEATETRCDGLDNDCDGQTDVGLLGGPASQGLGVCADLRQECAGEAGWVDPNDWASQVAYEPTEVTCDGLDNDCDGNVDEGLDDDPPAATLQFGVCAGAVQVCDGANGWVDPDYGDYNAAWAAEDTACDATDNDCDGGIDESCQPEGPPTNTTRNPFEDCGCQTTSPTGSVFAGAWLVLLGLTRRRRS
ncbi:MAG: hypothetical protein EP330_30710 [Deltaproteobacteria bacterium]|nr:MAG: hypothetical protein EP330_30710 [Deltaproteobacteria bacterium]